MSATKAGEILRKLRKGFVDRSAAVWRSSTAASGVVCLGSSPEANPSLRWIRLWTNPPQAESPKEQLTMFYVYVLQSRIDRTYYIGHTQNVTVRLGQHNRGKYQYT